ncbi:hypothetical protein OIU34_38230 [Pararhizobium sp. BT-229]|uniref:hypothetical protein n=1 Tax=Pararhizobium sp. BT-229 TaxID=2986923 RepID=UPI0021F6B60C|nr:hypothetical protein [Pararhizobium sp. BT-229]MCV9967666.1 hypothetical protein [Pararhizobium sp. BT-229]
MVSRNLPFEYFFLSNVRFSGDIVANVAGRPVRDVAIDLDGDRYRFIGLAGRGRCGRIDVAALRQQEWIVAPDLVYEKMDGRG